MSRTPLLGLQVDFFAGRAPLRAQSTFGSLGEDDIVASAAGQQHAGFTFANSTAWFMICAAFKAA